LAPSFILKLTPQQALDVVGQAGKPRKILGFQTHQTPVKLAATKWVGLLTEGFIPFGHVLEGFVILQKILMGQRCVDFNAFL
jgi:hypothetical protein